MAVSSDLASLKEGKRSAVAVVNDSPVDCQSRDRAARRRWHGKAVTEGVSYPLTPLPQTFALQKPAPSKRGPRNGAQQSDKFCHIPQAALSIPRVK